MIDRRGFLGRMLGACAALNMPFSKFFGVKPVAEVPLESLAVPQFFDFEAIRSPLLYGEIVKYVQGTESAIHD